MGKVLHVLEVNDGGGGGGGLEGPAGDDAAGTAAKAPKAAPPAAEVNASSVHSSLNDAFQGCLSKPCFQMCFENSFLLELYKAVCKNLFDKTLFLKQYLLVSNENSCVFRCVFKTVTMVFDVQTQAAGGVSDGEGGGSGMPACVAKSLFELSLSSHVRFDALELRSSRGLEATRQLDVAVDARFDALENILKRDQEATWNNTQKLFKLSETNRLLEYKIGNLKRNKASQEEENRGLRNLHESHSDSHRVREQHLASELARCHQLLFDQSKIVAEIPSLLGQIGHQQAELRGIHDLFSFENGSIGLRVRDAKLAMDEITSVTETSKERLRHIASLEEIIRCQIEEIKSCRQVAQITIFCHINTARHHI